VNSNSGQIRGCPRATVKCSFFQRLQTVLFNTKRQEKPESTFLRSYKTLRYEWSLVSKKKLKKANQCMYRGCDCGYSTDKLHQQPAMRSMATTMGQPGTMRTITMIMVRSAPRADAIWLASGSGWSLTMFQVTAVL